MPALDALRTHTRHQHEALHGHPLLQGLSSDSLTRSDLHDILLAFDAAYTTTELGLSDMAPDLMDNLPNAPVLDWLARDLVHFGLSPLGMRLRLKAPRFDTPSRLMGYLYVKQGSTLGGHVISRHLQSHLGLRPHIDQHFFAGYGVATGVEWRRFMLALERFQSLNRDEMLAAAADAFTHITAACDAVADLRVSHGV